MGERADKTDKTVVMAKSSGMVVGTGARRMHPWQLAGMALGVLLLAVVIGGGTRWWQQYERNKKAATVSAVASTAGDAEGLAVDGKYDEATKQVQAALKNPQLTPDQKYTLYFQQGVTDENAKKYTMAVADYKQADAITPTQGTAEAIARVATAAGDKATAIAYYKKAIDRVPSTYTLKADTIAAYKQNIKDLGGQP